MARLILKEGREKSLRQRHPWIYSGAVERIDDPVKGGEVVEVNSSRGEFLGKVFYNPRSQIVGRVLSFEPAEIDYQFFRERIEQARKMRQALEGELSGNARRLINAEGDLLPGLYLDSYGNHFVIKYHSLGMQLRQETLKKIIVEQFHPESIFIRIDPEAAEMEGMEYAPGQLFGTTPDRVEIEENGVRFLVDLKEGQKTGFYLDQKINRRKVSNYARGRTILDLFCHSGGFGLTALRNGAKSALFLDSSQACLDLLRDNIALNGMGKEATTVKRANIFSALPHLTPEEIAPSLIILDPPAMARSRKDIRRAARGYLFLNAAAMKILSPGGILATFSCSHYIDDKLFRQIAWEAALEAGREAQSLEYLSASPDHPVSIHHPEGAYLKGLILLIR